MTKYFIDDVVSHITLNMIQGDNPISLNQVLRDYGVVEGAAYAFKLDVIDGDEKHTLDLDTHLTLEISTSMHFTVPDDVKLFEKSRTWKIYLMLESAHIEKTINYSTFTVYPVE